MILSDSGDRGGFVRTLSILLCAITALGGCATFQEPALQPVSNSTACKTPKSSYPDHIALCDAIEKIVLYADGYETIHSRSDTGNALLRSAIVTSAITGAGLAVFGAGSDAIAGTAFGSGALSITDNSLNLRDRAVIARDAVRVFHCFAEIGDTFAQTYDLSFTSSSGASVNLREYVEDLFPGMGADIAIAERHVETNPALATSAAAALRQRLTAKIIAANEAYQALGRLRSAFSTIYTDLRRNARESDDLLSGRLQSKEPDIQSIVNEIQTLARSEPETPEPSDNGTANTAQANAIARARGIVGAAPPAPTDQDFIDALKSRVLQVRIAQPKTYAAEFDRIPACKAEAAT